MKKLALSCIISAALLLTSTNSASAAQTLQFSKSTSKTLMASPSSFIELPSKNNVKLDKIWTITFSTDISTDKIEGILVQQDSDFVPVSIAVSGKNTISVKPTSSYAPNSKYTLKIFLSNGSKYSMSFTTEDAYKNIDSSNNDSYSSASTVTLGDKLNGSLDGKNDSADWYKFVVPKDASVTISAKNTTDTNNINLYLYDKNGDNDNYIAADSYGDPHYSNKSVRSVTEGLAAGTYYIKLNSSDTLNYSITLAYNYEASNNDIETNNSYLNAQDLNLNNETTGHIGYMNEDSSKDSADYYKFTLTKDGEANFNLSNNTGDNINLYLYCKNGDNDSYIAADSYGDPHYENKSIRSIDKYLAAGTYYIKITSDNPEMYSLKSTFTEDSLQNDIENNDSYMKALTINSNDTKTGHIGYFKDDTSQDKSDWYKITIDQTKDLNINLNGENGNNINLYLYAENGDNDNYISADSYGDPHYSNKSIRHISKTLDKGVYYIKVNSDSSTGYTLTTN
ncbi:PPC domain-containing protein [Clostridium neuense]|uniref:PPC domain-containing protein n=1 Tax=Clostridium neuense TaxID=1728934 RepID=A0ABW8T8X7_9CLOT